MTGNRCYKENDKPVDSPVFADRIGEKTVTRGTTVNRSTWARNLLEDPKYRLDDG